MPWSKGNVVSVRISKSAHERLQEYKKKTGIPIVFTIEKALEQYFRSENGDGREKGM